MDVREVMADEWATLRAFRLRALQTDPRAFGAVWREEEAFPESRWRERATPTPESATLIIEEQNAWLGICTVITKAPQADLLGMWVAPEARGKGVALALLETAAARARTSGATSLSLWVNVEQTPAAQLYARAGFTASGPPVHGTRDPTRVFLPMRRELVPSTSSQAA